MAYVLRFRYAMLTSIANQLDSYMKYIQHRRREQMAAMHERLQFRIDNIRHLNIMNEWIYKL